MTGSITYFADCASFQGVPSWSRVAAVCGGGAEKVTEGAGATAYVNPDWALSKGAMTALAVHGWIPVAYMFLDAEEPGASQAQWFAQHAGNLDGWGIAVDFERALNGNPTLQQARDCTAELRKLYPRHPVGGYCPHWYTGGEDLTFCDWLWASEYVNGSGDPGVLYATVPAAWWAPYGGRSPLMLQFTASAAIAGISGPVDCSAFHGTQAQLGARVLPAPAPAPKPPPVPVPAAASPRRVDSTLISLYPGETPVTFPVWASASAYKEIPAYGNCSLIVTGDTGTVVAVTLYHGNGSTEQHTVTPSPGKPVPVVPSPDWSACTEVRVHRTDTKAALSASAAFRTW